MRTHIVSAIIASLALFGTAPEGEARPYHKYHGGDAYVSGYRSCGTPVYQERYVRHHKKCGRPVWGTRYVAPPRAYHYHRPVCPPPVRYCPPPVRVCPPTYYHGGYPRNGVVIQGTFRL